MSMQREEFRDICFRVTVTGSSQCRWDHEPRYPRIRLKEGLWNSGETQIAREVFLMRFKPGSVDYLWVGGSTLGKENNLNKSVTEGQAKMYLDHGKGFNLAKCRAESSSEARKMCRI